MRRLSARQLGLVLGLALIGLAFAPSAMASTPLDTVTASGSGGPFSPPIVTNMGDVPLSEIDITAQSGTSGQNPSGTASFGLAGIILSGSVSCLAVTGPDRGAGTAAAPTTAVVRFVYAGLFLETVQVVDNGGNGADTVSVWSSSPGSSTGCSIPSTPPLTATLTDGRAVVFDAPVVPTSMSQCFNGGWRNFPQFTNLGLCVRFVETGK
jgi:hypothetical protein